MTQMVKFPSIEQFRNIVRAVRSSADYHGKPRPTLNFRGTVKVHGTNASYANDGKDTWTQSRENIITPLNDNFGWSQYVNTHLDDFNALMAFVRFQFDAKEGDIVTIYGEWAGKGIQSGIGMSQVDKTFIVFQASMGDHGSEHDNRVWLDPVVLQNTINQAKIDFTCTRIVSVANFGVHNVAIDFNNPEAVQNDLVRLTLAVEEECPVAVGLGAKDTPLVGEGIVWVLHDDQDLGYKLGDLRFKVKGEKHSVTKVKKLASVDTEKVANVKEFVEKVVTENRLIQMKDQMRQNGLDPDQVKNTGEFIRLVMADVVKEELDTLTESGLTTKDISGPAANAARQWFMTNLK